MKIDTLQPWLVRKCIICITEIEETGSALKLLVVLYRKGHVLQELVESLHEAREHCGHTDLLELILERSCEMGGMHYILVWDTNSGLD